MIYMNVLVRLFSLKFLTAVFGVVFSILQVRYFGSSRAIEIYFAAQTLVYLISSLSQSGQLSEVFLPIFKELNLINKDYGFKALSIVLNRLIIPLSLIVILLIFLAPLIIQILIPGFESNEKEQAVIMFRVLSPFIILQTLKSFFTTTLNAEKKFGRAEFLGLISTLINIFSLLILYPKFQVWALVFGLLIGKLIEIIFYFSELKKIGYKFEFIFNFHLFDHKSFFKTLSRSLLYVSTTQIYLTVLTASISHLPEGVFAVFKYVQNIEKKIRGLVIQPFITIFFTKYFELKNNFNSLKKVVTINYSNLILVVHVLFIGSLFFGKQFIDLIWGGEKFSNYDVNLAYNFFLLCILGMLFNSVGLLFRKIVISEGSAKQLYTIWSFSQLISALLTYLLIKHFKVNGLLFILPINNFLLAQGSYYVYKKTVNFIRFLKVTNHEIKLVILILFSIVSFCFMDIFPIDSLILRLFINLLIVILLIIYPIKTFVKNNLNG